MCQFFSAISDGNGKVLFFTVEDIAKIMANGNPKSYEWNSHTSIAHFNGIEGVDEDKWNKWEYDCDQRKLKVDQLNATDDSEKVRPIIEKYLTTENTIYLRNFYLRNSGNSNSGNSNSGHRNSGHWNSGNWNSGHWNSGNWNSGHWNSGNSNSGNSNSGNRNSGHSNSGNSNSGNSNSGDWNSGNWNSGCFNTKTPDTILVFNKPCKREKWDNAQKPSFLYFQLNVWVDFRNMTEDEKKADVLAEMRGGYLKRMDYKEAFQLAYSKASDEDKALLLKLPNFNKKLFYEISGIKV
jgi:hypothetical protein